MARDYYLVQLVGYCRDSAFPCSGYFVYRNSWGDSWQSGVFGSNWRGWWSILDGRAHSRTPIAAVARNRNRLDLFVAGADGKTYTAAWERATANIGWGGWWRIGP